MFRVEGVLHLDGNILDADGIDGRRVDDLCAEVTQLHSLYIRQFVDGIGRLDDLRVGGHEAVDVGPDLKYLGIHSSSNDGCRVVGAAAPQVGGLVAVAVAGNEARNYGDGLVAQVLERLFHQLVGQFRVEHVLTLLILCTDEVAGVHAHAVLEHSRDDVRTEALTIADNGVLRLCAQVVNQVHAVVDAPQLVEELVYIIE